MNRAIPTLTWVLFSLCAVSLLAEENSQPPPRRISVSGTVLAPDGKPVAGATVFLREWRSTRLQQGDLPSEAPASDILAHITSDEKGRFLMADVAYPPIFSRQVGTAEPPIYADVVAQAKNYGLAWEHLPQLGPLSPVTLKLSPEARVRGRLLDRQGKPLAGIRLQVLRVQPLDQVAEVAAFASGGLDLLGSELPLGAKTDGDGNFEIAGLPPDRRICLIPLDEKYARLPTYAATTDKPQPKLTVNTYSPDNLQQTRQETVHAGFFIMTAQPGHRLQGRITFEDSAKSEAGVAVHIAGNGLYLSTATDAGGRYSVTQLLPGRYWVMAVPPAKIACLGKSVSLTIGEGNLSSKQDVNLPRGIVITGRVIDEETAKGIPRVSIQYQPTPAGASRLGPFANPVTSDPDGRFEIAVPPGKGELLCYGGEGYYVPGSAADPAPRLGGGYLTQTIEAKAGEAVPKVKFALSRGLVLTGRVLNPDGKPLPGTQVTAPKGSTISNAQGEFSLSGLDPNRTHELHFIHKERRLGFKTMLPISKEKKATLQAKLQPAGCVSGRVLDENRKPISRVSVQVYMIAPQLGGTNYGFASSSTASLAADPDGRFTIDYLMPGGQYSVMISLPGYASYGGSYFNVQSGKTDPLGDISLVKADQSLAGVVVDPAGQPLADVDVQASASERNLSVYQHAKTDKEGRFHFRELPKAQLNVSAYKMVPTGQSNQAGQPYSTVQIYANLQVQAGRQDVQILLRAPSKEGTAATAGNPAPEFSVSHWLNRKDVRAGRGFVRDDFRGQVLLLAFLDEAKPSQRLLPQLKLLHEKWGDKGLSIVRVYESSAGEELAKLSHTTAALVKPGVVPGGYSQAFQKYGVKTTPTLVLVDRAGIVQKLDLETADLQAALEGAFKK